MLTQLGDTLKSAREKKGVSLQAIADGSDISAAYLQKLERGGVGAPSPHVLRRIAAALDLAYLDLMQSAGYLQGKESAEARLRESAPQPHPLAGQRLTPAEWRAVGAFIKALLAERKTREPEGGSH